MLNFNYIFKVMPLPKSCSKNLANYAKLDAEAMRDWFDKVFLFTEDSIPIPACSFSKWKRHNLVDPFLNRRCFPHQDECIYRFADRKILRKN